MSESAFWIEVEGMADRRTSGEARQQNDLEACLAFLEQTLGDLYEIVVFRRELVLDCLQQILSFLLLQCNIEVWINTVQNVLSVSNTQTALT
jgi:hypothetical protein